jgi:hypothetical protein
MAESLGSPTGLLVGTVWQSPFVLRLTCFSSTGLVFLPCDLPLYTLRAKILEALNGIPDAWWRLRTQTNTRIVTRDGQKELHVSQKLLSRVTSSRPACLVRVRSTDRNTAASYFYDSLFLPKFFCACSKHQTWGMSKFNWKKWREDTRWEKQT